MKTPDELMTRKRTSHKSIWVVAQKYHESILTLCLNEHERYRLAVSERRSGQEKLCQLDILIALAKSGKRSAAPHLGTIRPPRIVSL
jgi:hypothetical protein